MDGDAIPASPCRVSSRAASRVIAVSEFTKRELVSLLGVDPGVIRVVPNAVEDVFTPDGPRGGGRLRARGRHARAAQEPARIAQAVDGELRVVGARGWGGVTPPANVTWLGDVTDEELAALYRGARCLVYASLYEGFGIPVAEALACGCPVVTSAGSPMAELAGDDAALVDPRGRGVDPRGIARAPRPAPRARRRAGPRWRERRGPSTRSSRDRSSTPTCSAATARARRPTSSTCCAQLPLVAPDLTFAAVTRRPDLVPEGVEPIELPARFQEARMAWALPRLLRRLGPDAAHFQHALPLGWNGPSV